MARTVLHTIFPFREGTDRPLSDWHYLTIELETAPSKMGFEPFRIVWHAVRLIHEYRFMSVVDAVEALPDLVACMTRNHSDRDWSHLPHRYQSRLTKNPFQELEEAGL